MNQRRGFLSARGVHVGRPGQAQLINVVFVHQRQRREALFGIVAAIAQPFASGDIAKHGFSDSGHRTGLGHSTRG